DGVKYLVERGLTDPRRVGIYGWSYGGYMSLMCLLQAPDVFTAAVSGAPVTHYDGYDTHYTEHYMSTPQLNPEGYELGSVQHYVENLRGKLLIIHGLIDENVHFRHTARLINALIAADKPYELLLLPDSRHLTRKPQDIRYMFKRTAEHFLKHLCSD
ncbi:MAG: prolyl oligopeptidase family serine peptidase, partial [Anaerolineaceae bacterium]